MATASVDEGSRRSAFFRVDRAVLVAARVLLQIRRDPRFLVLSLAVPGLLVAILRYVLEALGNLQRLGVDTGDYAIPAGALLVHFITYVLSAIALVRERNGGTLERMLVAGLRRAEIVAGYVGGYAVIAFVQTAIVVGMTWLLFDVSLLGRLAPVYATMFLLALASIALGLLVSSTARSEGQIFPFIPLVFVPSLVLSGLLIPFDNLAWPLQILGRILPLTYAEDVLIPIFVHGATFLSRIGYFLILGAYALVLLIVASLTLKESE